jgi:tRNA(fMet)-specific endonuclease VapC
MPSYILDTDTLSLYQRGHPVVCQRVSERPAAELAITVISIEEQFSGWQALLRRAKGAEALASVYQRLTDTAVFLARLQVFSFTMPAIARYDHLRTLKLNIGKMDLRIAAIVLEHDGTLVTRNLRDFARVPDLRTVDWTV